MSDTDNTYAMKARDARPTALGDLRFAGTIATGLVAGTLGLGAIALPLVGWKDWPQGLTQESASAPVQLAKVEARAGNEQPSRPSRDPSRGGGAAPISTFVSLPAGGAVAGGDGSLTFGSGDGTSTSTSDPDGTIRTEQRRSKPPTTQATSGSGAGNFDERKKDFGSGDDDGDGVPNRIEENRGLNANDPSDGGAIVSGSGLTNSNDFHVRSLPHADSDGDGDIDGDDDSDYDGIPNGVEQVLGTNPANGDSDGDGIPDGLDDHNGDGIPDMTPVTPVRRCRRPIPSPSPSRPSRSCRRSSRRRRSTIRPRRRR